MSLIQTLCRLQAVDQEWDEKGRQFQLVRQRLADQSELEERRQAQENLQQQLSRVRTALQDAELRMASLQQKIETVGNELYSGHTTSSRELANLQQEREMHLRHLSETEDEVLMGLTQAEELEEAVAKGAQELVRFEKAWAHEQEQLRVQYRELGTRLQQLKREREALRVTVGRAELGLYDELRKSKGGQALSPMKGSMCQTCRVTVPSNKAQLAQSGETLVCCEGCGRILYPE
jgi:uncharacterized protein